MIECVEGAAELAMRSWASWPDADGDGGAGGVAGGLASFGGGPDGCVDPAAELGGGAGVGFAAEAVDGQVAQERAGAGLHVAG
jgi:hypothetical protein